MLSHIPIRMRFSGALAKTQRAFVVATLATMMTTVVAVPTASAQQTDNSFSWSGVIPSGNRIMIKNLNGSVEIERSRSSRVEVTAEKRWRRGDPADVSIVQINAGQDVVICGLWGDNTRCDERGIQGKSSNNNRNNDVSVHFVVKVPNGVRVDVSTVNGGLTVNDVTSEVIVSTVNGDINARSAGGPVRARTVNGSIDVSMGSTGNADDLEYGTVNGSITIELPANFSAQVEISTVNGRVSTDFPITMSGSISPRRLRGTIGDGDTRLRASTVNGSVSIKKRE